jgi:hypothetical protein
MGDCCNCTYGAYMGWWEITVEHGVLLYGNLGAVFAGE